MRRKQRGKEKERERKRQNENGVFISYSFGKKFTRRWKTTAKVHASLSISTLERFLHHLADRSAVVFCILLLCDRETFLKAQSAKLSQFETRRLETIERERERKRAALSVGVRDPTDLLSALQKNSVFLVSRDSRQNGITFGPVVGQYASVFSLFLFRSPSCLPLSSGPSRVAHERQADSP